jgi:2-oxo-4-hydroxy-4-carboxy-5-ureidoimidazoline decarboxylase
MVEQGTAGVSSATADTVESLAELNRRYEEKFGFIYIVCATGKSSTELLAILRDRLNNEREQELRTAAAEQAQITRLRLLKLIESLEEPENGFSQKSMSTISTHILDTSRGKPANGVAVYLESQNHDETWEALTHAWTDDEGRVKPFFLLEEPLPAGTYRLALILTLILRRLMPNVLSAGVRRLSNRRRATALPYTAAHQSFWLLDISRNLVSRYSVGRNQI